MINNDTVPVSVIIPCFRCINTIERAVESVYTQTMLPYEVILVDDYSNDGTLEFLYKLSKNYPPNWIKVVGLSKNMGPGSARNKGWNLSNQDYIAFLDADDSWHQNKIAIQYSWMKKNPHVTISGHPILPLYNARAENKLTSSQDAFFYKLSKYKMLIKSQYPTPSVMLKKDIKERFIENSRYAEDANLWLRLIFSGHICMRTDNILAFSYKADFGDSGLSSNLLTMQKAVVKNYVELYKAKKISRLTLYTITIFSYFKFIRRIAISCYNYFDRKFTKLLHINV